MPASIEQILSSYNDRAPLSEAFTIPASWYVDPRIAELERLNVFSKTWQLVGRTSQLQNAGDFVATRVASEPIVVVRGADGTLRAFFNVCRHHAAAVVTQPCGQASILQCPYHGWKYDVTGQCIDVPSEPEGSEYARRIKLQNYPLIELGGILWTYMGPPEVQPPQPEWEFATVPRTHTISTKRLPR